MAAAGSKPRPATVGDALRRLVRQRRRDGKRPVASEEAVNGRKTIGSGNPWPWQPWSRAHQAGSEAGRPATLREQPPARPAGGASSGKGGWCGGWRSHEEDAFRVQRRNRGRKRRRRREKKKKKKKGRKKKKKRQESLSMYTLTSL